MVNFIIRRVTVLIPLLLIISILSFAIIQLPPGSYIDSYIQSLRASGFEVQEQVIATLTRQYGLDKPLYVQYYMWMKGFILEGRLGRSFQWDQPVTEILKERIPMTILISLLSMLLVWIISIPVAIYSATHQYSVFDYIATIFGFVGLAMPNFLFALLFMWVIYDRTGVAITGLFSTEFIGEPWSMAKFLDLLQNIWLPMIVIGLAGTAGNIRVMRATLLDELGKLYVTTARAKGLPEWKVILKYPVRTALNPVVSTIGWLLPGLVGGEVIVAIVLNLRTVGPVLHQAILTQDMYLAGSVIMILSSLTVIGTFISDILLAWLDPRIRYEK
ncbi:MAG: ABC transporter permease [Firmicutes bacterium]|nr:ABC transporter permease [Bacillota bacterium]